ncbi:MAG TPA: hypothetical protein VHO02_05405 [Fibrobacteria bacterium]|jgi:hypothetical protein|nr:hypothetical protein [Fibrobacteria bacterium]
MMPEHPRSRPLPTTLPAVFLAALLAGCVTVEKEPDPIVGAKRIFASAQQVTGNLKGLSGADSLCGAWAQAAALGGSWKAFLSTSGVNAKDRINDVGPWYNVNQTTLLFNNKTGFTVGAQSAIRTEYGGSASGNAWTGTKANGTADMVNCSNWTQGGGSAYASVGSPSITLDDGPGWMAKGGNAPACSTPARVYCIEQ